MVRPKAPSKTPRAKAKPEALPLPSGSARERVLQSALEVFGELGYEAASTTEIARRAGVTQPLVHYHFDSKQRLWEAAVEALFARLSVLTDGASDDLRDLDPVSRLKVMLRRYVRFSAKHPEVARFFLREGAHDGPRLRWLVEKHAGPLSVVLGSLLRDAQAQGVLRHLDVPSICNIIIAAGSHLFTVPALAKAEHGIDLATPTVVERYADTLVEVLFHGVAASAPSHLSSAR